MAALRRVGDSLELRDIFGALGLRPVSCYAFMRRWLLPSRLPGCHRPRTSFPTEGRIFGTLANGLGCFPLDPGPSRPGSD
jgi:hypothetical protein